MLKAKILSHCPVKYVAGNPHQLPTLLAELSILTACSDLIVVVYIDIEHKLSLLRNVRHTLLRNHCHNSSNIDLQRNLLLEHSLQFVRMGKTDVSLVHFLTIDVQCKVKLTMLKG